MKNAEGAAKRLETKRTCVLVLGAHRSGTSALSRLLNIHGCDLPATLMGASPGNEDGHWESLAIADFDDDLLGSAGFRWDDVQSFGEAWYASPRYPSYFARAKAVLESEFGESPLFVLKDPRICRIAPFWLDVLENSGVEPAIVLPIREPHEVAGSIERRDERPSWYGSLIWLRHVLDAEYASRGYNRVFSSFDMLRSDWRWQIDRIAKGLDLRFPRVSPISASEADQFIKAGRPERRFDAANSALTHRPELGSWLNDTFSIFDRWIRNGEQKEDQAHLDEIRSDFDRVTFALGSCLLPGNTEGNAEQGVRRRIDLQNQLTARQDEVSELREHLANATAHAEQLSAAHTHSHEEMSAHVAARDAEIARLAQDVAAHQHALAQREQAHTEMSAHVAARDAEIARLAQDVAAHQHALAQREQAHAEMSAHVAARDAEIAQLTQDLAANRDDLERMREAKRDLADQLASANDDLALQGKELAARDEQWKHAIEEITQLKDKLALKEKRLGKRDVVIDQKYLEELDISREAQIRADLESRLAEAEVRLGRVTTDRRKALTEAEHWRSTAVEFERRIELLSGELASAAPSSQSGEQSQIEALRAEIDLARQGTVTAQQDVKARFDEIAKISAVLMDYETQLAAQQARLVEQDAQLTDQNVRLTSQEARLADAQVELLDKQWLHETLRVLMRIPSKWHFLPSSVRRRREQDKLNKAGLFDPDAYIARYPDVAAEGFDPLKHYIMHGLDERRDRSPG